MVEPSELLISSVPTPAAFACAAIEATLPPLEALRYQIHMPCPASAVPFAVLATLVGAGAGAGFGGAGGCSACVTTLIGPNRFDLRPFPSITAISPEWALLGTVTTNPCVEECRWALGELLAIRASHECGNATACPLFRPFPCSSSVPCVETSCSLVSQLLAGTQRAPAIVTAGWVGALDLGLVLPPACDVLVDFFVAPPPVVVPPEEPVTLPDDPPPEEPEPPPEPPDPLAGEEVPPVIWAAAAPAGSASATAAANARNRNRLFARVLSMRGGADSRDRPYRLMGFATYLRDGSCVKALFKPSESQAVRATVQAGLQAGPLGGRAG